jgi:hypothetical protein
MSDTLATRPLEEQPHLPKRSKPVGLMLCHAHARHHFVSARQYRFSEFVAVGRTRCGGGTGYGVYHEFCGHCSGYRFVGVYYCYTAEGEIVSRKNQDHFMLIHLN